MGFKNSQLTKKKAAVNNWIISNADRYPSENDAMLLSVMPNSHDETPKNQIPFLRELKNTDDSDNWRFSMLLVP